MKKESAILLIGILAIGLVLSGCPVDGGEADIWSDITSLDQVYGSWKGTFRQSDTIKNYYESNGQTWSDEMAAVFGNMKVTTTVVLVMNFSENPDTAAGIATITIAFSGGNIDLV